MRFKNSFVLQFSISKLSKTTRLSLLLNNSVRKASWNSFLFSLCVTTFGFGPKITPPPFHKGERLEHARARPVPFCYQGLRPPPRTSLRVFVEAVYW